MALFMCPRVSRTILTVGSGVGGRCVQKRLFSFSSISPRNLKDIANLPLFAQVFRLQLLQPLLHSQPQLHAVVV
jgi:hypothetical protein